MSSHPTHSVHSADPAHPGVPAGGGGSCDSAGPPRGSGRANLGPIRSIRFAGGGRSTRSPGATPSTWSVHAARGAWRRRPILGRRRGCGHRADHALLRHVVPGPPRHAVVVIGPADRRCAESDHRRRSECERECGDRGAASLKVPHRGSLSVAIWSDRVPSPGEVLDALHDQRPSAAYQGAKTTKLRVWVVQKCARRCTVMSAAAAGLCACFDGRLPRSRRTEAGAGS